MPVLLLVVWLLVSLPTQAQTLADARKLVLAGQSQAAWPVIEAQLAASPQNAELRFLRGVVLSDLGRKPEAMQVFLELTQEFPELPDPFNNLAVLHAARGELELARSLLESALRNNPKHRAARENLGDVFVQLASRLWQSLADEGPAENALKQKLQLARQISNATPATKSPSP